MEGSRKGRGGCKGPEAGGMGGPSGPPGSCSLPGQESGSYPRPRSLFRPPPREPVLPPGPQFPYLSSGGEPSPSAGCFRVPPRVGAWLAGRGRGPQAPAVLRSDLEGPFLLPSRASGLNNRHRRRKQNELTADPLIPPGLGIWQRQPRLIKGIPRHSVFVYLVLYLHFGN